MDSGRIVDAGASFTISNGGYVSHDWKTTKIQLDNVGIRKVVMKWMRVGGERVVIGVGVAWHQVTMTGPKP